MLIDSHCHLTFPDFADELESVVARARAAGVEGMLTISTRLGDFDKVRGLAQAHGDIWCTVGVHPHEVEAEPDTTTEQLVQLAAYEKVVGIGETGLDYFYDHSPRGEQQAAFDVHLAAACETELPVIVHTREADADTN
ncbi:MAG: TatD family hydrolase, partial [Alphaproteobacteria bacterium]